jgi:hypothetical protein
LHDECEAPVERIVGGSAFNALDVSGLPGVFVLTILFFQLPSLWAGAMRGMAVDTAPSGMARTMLALETTAYGGRRGVDGAGTTAEVRTPEDAPDARHGANLA